MTYPTPDRPECSGDPAREGHGRPSDAADGVLPPSPHVEYSASRGQSKVEYWVSRKEGDRIRNAAISPPDNSAPPKPAPDAMREALAQLRHDSDEQLALREVLQAGFQAFGFVYPDIATEHMLGAIASLSASAPVPSHDGAGETRLITDEDRQYASELLADLTSDDLPRLEIAARWFRKARVEQSISPATRAAEPDAVRVALLKYLDIFLYPNPEVDLSGLVCKHGLAIEACPARECSNPMAYETAIKRARDYIAAISPAPTPTPGLSITQIERAAKACRDKYCELMSGERAWADLTDDERGILMVSLSAGFSAVSVVPAVGVTREAQEIVTEWLGMFDPPPQIDFQQSEFLQQAIASALGIARTPSAPDATVSGERAFLITRADLDKLLGAAHSRALLGGDNAYQGCLTVEALLADIAARSSPQDVGRETTIEEARQEIVLAIAFLTRDASADAKLRAFFSNGGGRG